MQLALKGIRTGKERKQKRTAAEKFLGEKGTDHNRRSASRTKTKIGSTCPNWQIHCRGQEQRKQLPRTLDPKKEHGERRGAQMR
jgi:hypothetical protein